MKTVARISVPLRAVDRGPQGDLLAVTDGNVNGWPFELTVTQWEMHYAFADRDGPRFVVDLNELAKEGTNEIERLMGVNRGIR